jgi:hypothetical protein
MGGRRCGGSKKRGGNIMSILKAFVPGLGLLGGRRKRGGMYAGSQKAGMYAGRRKKGIPEGLRRYLENKKKMKK